MSDDFFHQLVAAILWPDRPAISLTTTEVAAVNAVCVIVSLAVVLIGICVIVICRREGVF